MSELWPYMAMVFVGFLPNETWRWLGIVMARGLDERSEIVVWVRAVATAILAAVIAKLTLVPPGALADVSITIRLASVALGFVVFLVFGRSVLAGVAFGELVLIGGWMVWRP